jgi:peroxiredoxin Q/BCP
MALNPGDVAPDFELPGNGGQTIRLSSLAGKPVVVYFYPKDDTPGCTKEAIGFSCLAADFEAAGVTVIGISTDSVKSHDKFVAKHDLKIALGSDADHAVMEAFGVWVEKSMYGKSYMGVERSTFLIGRDGKVAAAWPKVKVEGHAEAVLAAAKAL